MANFGLAVLSGLLLVVIHPDLNLSFLAPIAIAPLILALMREERSRYRFLLGYTTGFVFWSGLNYWIHFVLAEHGGMGPALAAVAFAGFLILKAVHLGFFGLLAGKLLEHKWAALTVPALWVGIERFPTWFEYRWLTLGNAAVDSQAAQWVAPLAGVYGMSFLLAAAGMFPRFRMAAILIPIVLWPAHLSEQPSSHQAVSVQPAIADREDWTTEQATALQKRLEYLSLQNALASRSRLILWPEMPAPVYYDEDRELRESLTSLARTTSAHVLIGTVAHNPNGAPLNAALMIKPTGEPLGRYDKMFPVPFGEYVPFPFGTVIEKVTSEVGDFASGTRVVVFDTPDARVGAFICYESAFPHLVRRFATAGATVFANLSNDGYFGRTAARQQHLSLVRMRALENRRWILRSTNDGITASVDPQGSVRKALPPLVEGAGLLPFQPRADLTFYSMYGDVFAWFCLALGLIAVVISIRGGSPGRLRP